MAKIINDELFDEILSEGPTSYFRHTEDKGEVEIVFKSGIAKVEPGEEDLEGREWNPPIVDKVTGQPYLDFKGNPREPWAKFEARALIDGIESIYPFNGRNSSVLRAMLGAMRANKFGNSDLPGTKWSINRLGKWDWKIEFLGHDDEDTSSSSSPKPETVEVKENDKIKEALTDYKLDKPEKVKEGIPKNSLIHMLCFELDMTPVEVEDELKKLDKSGFLSMTDNKVVIK